MPAIQSKIDEKSKKFLRAVRYYGGEATTTEIRQRTGLNQTEVNYRFSKLEDLGLIEISYADAGHGNRDPPKVANLTGQARAEIERGLLGDSDGDDGDDESDGVVEVSEEEFRSLKQDLQQLEQRVNVLTQARSAGDGDGEDVDEEVSERIENLEKRIEQLQGQAPAGGGGSISGEDVAEAPAVRKLDKRVSELEDDFADFEEYVYEWNEAVETYLYAFRRVVSEKLDVSFESYLELVGEEDSDGL